MSKWLQVFSGRDRRKDQERYACKGCGFTWDGSHSSSPPNGVCMCPECKGHLGNSELFRLNYDLINWDKTDQPKHVEHL